eukprot:5806549-Prymnesium_polylepis.1
MDAWTQSTSSNTSTQTRPPDAKRAPPLRPTLVFTTHALQLCAHPTHQSRFYPPPRLSHRCGCGRRGAGLRTKVASA